jgi:putative protease
MKREVVVPRTPEGSVMSGIHIGEVTHFYNRISVAVLALAGTLKIGDTIHFLGHTTDFRQRVTSLQIEHRSVEKASAGEDVALLVDLRVRAGDKIFKIPADE